jgi:hypothetical protein
MAFEKGKLVNATELYDDRNERVVWDSRNGMMFAWQIEVELEGEIVYLKAFTKKEDRYSFKNGTNISFETDWDESRGLAYAKRIKDLDSKYANDNVSSRGGSRPAARPTSRPVATPIPAQSKPTGLSKSAILYQSQMAAIKYLQVASSQKELALNLNTIQGMGVKFKDWITAFDDKALAIKALNLAIETAKMNKSLEANEAAITSSKELQAVASIYYGELKG